MNMILKALAVLVVIFAGYLFKYFDRCDDASISKNVDEYYITAQTDDSGKNFRTKMQANFDKYDVPVEEQEGISKAYLEFALRTKRKCEVPQSLKDKMTGFVYNDENQEGAVCALDIYKQNAIKKYEGNLALYKSAEFEDKLYTTVSKSLKKPHRQEKFKAKWADPKFRKTIAVAALQYNLMKKANCRNSYSPVTDILLSYLGS